MKRSVLWMLALLVVGCGRTPVTSPEPQAQPKQLVEQQDSSPAGKPGNGSPPGSTNGEGIDGVVVEVIDGDTVTFRREDESMIKVRLFGIDAPEGTQQHGDKATAALKEKILFRDALLTPMDTDRYGRTVGALNVDGESVGLAMIRDGHAWHYKKYSDDAALANAETEARNAGRGLWSTSNPIPPWDYRKDPTGAKITPLLSQATTPTDRSALQPVTGKGEGEAKNANGSPADARAFAKSLEPRFPELQPKQRKVTVYVTKSGSKYHAAGCRHLRKSSIAMELSRAQAQYSPCSACGGGGHSSTSTAPTKWTGAELNRDQGKWTVTGIANGEQTDAVVFIDGNGNWKLQSLRVGRKLVFKEQAHRPQPDTSTKKLAAIEEQPEHDQEETETPPIQEKQAEPQPEAVISQELEDRAAGKLRMAKILLSRDKGNKGERRLEEIIDEYPGTEAAIEAETLLTGRPPVKKRSTGSKDSDDEKSDDVADSPPSNSSDVKTVEEMTRELEDAAEQQSTAAESLKLYDDFLAKMKLSDDAKAVVIKQREVWKQRADRKFVRLGSKWVPPAEAEAARIEADNLMKQAFALIDVSDYEEAERLLNKASVADENGILADFCLGLFYSIQGSNSPDVAEQHYRTVLRRFPGHVPALNNIGLALVKQKKYNAALNYWQQAVQLSPRTPEITHNLGRLISEASRNKLSVKRTILTKYSNLYSLAITAGNGTPADEDTGWLYSFPVLPKADQGRVARANKSPDGNLIATGSGTGFVVKPGFILTNRHVVSDTRLGMADRVGVVIQEDGLPERELLATVVAVADDVDLAVLKCDGLTLPPLSLVNEIPRRGTEILILGFPVSTELGRNIKTTKGIVSALPDESHKNAMLFDADASHGNSGGPVCDSRGRVVGVLTYAFKYLAGESVNLTGGVPTTAAIQFLNLRPETAIAAADFSPPAEKSWADIDAEVSKSVVFLVRYDRSPSLVFGKGSATAQAQGPRLFLEDKSCSVCGGLSHINCPQNKCNKGRTTVKVPYTFVHGVGRNRRVLKSMKSVQKACPRCSGRGRISCPACSDGTDPTLQ